MFLHCDRSADRVAAVVSPEPTFIEFHGVARRHRAALWLRRVVHGAVDDGPNQQPGGALDGFRANVRGLDAVRAALTAGEVVTAPVWVRVVERGPAVEELLGAIGEPTLRPKDGAEATHYLLLQNCRRSPPAPLPPWPAVLRCGVPASPRIALLRFDHFHILLRLVK